MTLSLNTRLRCTCALSASVALVVVVAACGSSSKTTSTSLSAAPATSGIPSWAKTFQGYVGNKSMGAASSSATPVTIGWVNAQGGTVQAPEASTALNAAIKVINNDLDGVDGHPIKVVSCFVVSTEEEGQKCAQQFVNDSSISLVLEGDLPYATSFHTTDNGIKPVLGFNPGSTADATGKETYMVSAGVYGDVPAIVPYVKEVLHAKSLTWLYPNDDPIAVSGAKLLAAGAKAAGVKPILVGFPSSSTSLLSYFTAGNAQTSSATAAVMPNATLCDAGAKAAQALAIRHMISLELCEIPAVAKTLGDYPKWTYTSVVESANIPSADPYIAAWRTAMSTLAPHNNTVYDPFAELAFGTAMTADEIFNKIGASSVSPSTVNRALKAWHGPQMFGPPVMNFGKIPGLPALGSTAIRFYKYLGGGKWADATAGKWIAPPS